MVNRARTRRLLSRRAVLKSTAAAAALTLGASMLNLGRFQVFADTPRKYSARATKLVERSLVIDMLGVLKIDFRPEAYARTLTDQEQAIFRTCGITAFHNSIGTLGPQVVDDTLAIMLA